MATWLDITSLASRAALVRIPVSHGVRPTTLRG